MSQFIESIKVEDQKIHLLELHQQRVNQTFEQFSNATPFSIEELFKSLDLDDNGLFKFRITYDTNSYIRTQLIPYAIAEIESFELIEAPDLDYSYKYEDRSKLVSLKEKSRKDEIIITQNSFVTDSTFSNLIFLKNEKWYTPTTYLLNGVQRQNLLSKGLIQETEISRDNLKEYSHFQLINAMIDLQTSFIYPIELLKNNRPIDELGD